MAASALTTATAAALTSTLPDNAPKSNQQSPRHTASTSSVAVRAGSVEVSKALQEGEKFIKWDEVSWCCLLSVVRVLCVPHKSSLFTYLFIFFFSAFQRDKKRTRFKTRLISAFEALLKGERERALSEHLF